MDINTNNINIHYVKKGTGKPVLFLHGNGEDLHIFDNIIASLSEKYTTYAIDSRNHGQSSKTKKYSYDIMTEDTYSFLTELDLKNILIFGFSDGAIIALLLTLKYPHLVDKIILAGINIKPNAFHPEIYKKIKSEYERTKNPLFEMMLTQPNISLDRLEEVKTPTLILFGENDIFSKKSFIEINLAIKNSELLELKDNTHDSYISNKDLLIPIILQFFNK